MDHHRPSQSTTVTGQLNSTISLINYIRALLDTEDLFLLLLHITYSLHEHIKVLENIFLEKSPYKI